MFKARDIAEDWNCKFHDSGEENELVLMAIISAYKKGMSDLRNNSDGLDIEYQYQKLINEVSK